MVKPLGFGSERPRPGYDDGGNYPENRRIQFILEPQDRPEAEGAIELVSMSDDGSRLVLGKPIAFESTSGEGTEFSSKRLATRICFDAAEQLHELNRHQRPPYRLCVHSHTAASGAPDAIDASNARARLCAETIKGKMLQLDPQLSKTQVEELIVPVGFGASKPLPNIVDGLQQQTTALSSISSRLLATNLCRQSQLFDERNICHLEGGRWEPPRPSPCSAPAAVGMRQLGLSGNLLTCERV